MRYTEIRVKLISQDWISGNVEDVVEMLQDFDNKKFIMISVSYKTVVIPVDNILLIEIGEEVHIKEFDL